VWTPSSGSPSRLMSPTAVTMSLTESSAMSSLGGVAGGGAALVGLWGAPGWPWAGGGARAGACGDRRGFRRFSRGRRFRA
jgi:hypothetical protein